MTFMKESSVLVFAITIGFWFGVVEVAGKVAAQVRAYQAPVRLGDALGAGSRELPESTGSGSLFALDHHRP